VARISPPRSILLNLLRVSNVVADVFMSLAIGADSTSTGVSIDFSAVADSGCRSMAILLT
jgi:hypothetical protein